MRVSAAQRRVLEAHAAPAAYDWLVVVRAWPQAERAGYRSSAGYRAHLTRMRYDLRGLGLLEGPAGGWRLSAAGRELLA